MCKIKKLIERFCPTGVDVIPLADITREINIGVNPRNFFKLNPDSAEGFYVTVRELDGLQGVKKHEKTDSIDLDAVKLINARAHIEKGDILFSNTGTVGKLALAIETPHNWGVNEGIYVIKPKAELVESRFLYYYLDSNHAYKDYSKKFTGSTLKHVTQKALKEIKIPVPPLEVQREIVRVLDHFTLLSAELSAELKARKQQYQHYCDELYKPKEGWKEYRLGELGTLTRGKRFVKADAVDNGIPCIHYGELYTHYGVKAHEVKSHIREDIPKKLRYAKKNDVIIVGAGENDWDIGVGVAWLGEEEVAVHDACYTFEHNQNPLFISYYLRTTGYHQQIKKYVSTGKICAISAEGLGKSIIYAPDLVEQERIANQLSAFDSLLNSISEGIPAEIEARQNQYEYYRDKLLTFKEKETV